MPRSEKQKQKMLRLIEIFMRHTDENHGLSMNELISHLQGYGISAERKSLYDDIAVLGEMGFPIEKLNTSPPKYTLVERTFELAELKILVDAIQSSKFITPKKTRELIRKLEVFAGEYHSRELSRQVYVEDRVKTGNAAFIYNIDLIHTAINDSRMITFRYFDYNKKKEKVYRHSGARYTISPYTLVWNDENYYLVALDEDAKIVKNFRVDKMSDVSITEQPSSKSHKDFNPADYTRKIFGMYGGTEELVCLECKDRLSGVIIDRFGMDAPLIPTDDGFRVTLRLIVSPTFFSWVFGFFNDMRIVSPSAVQEQFVHWLDAVRSSYNQE